MGQMRREMKKIPRFSPKKPPILLSKTMNSKNLVSIVDIVDVVDLQLPEV